MLTLTKCRLACAVTLGLLGTGAYALPVFYENFDIAPYTPGDPAGCPPSWPGGAGTYPFPSGWLLRNVDNRTPSAPVSYVNDAWEDREDFGLDVSNCVAFSNPRHPPENRVEVQVLSSASSWRCHPAPARRTREVSPGYQPGPS